MRSAITVVERAELHERLQERGREPELGADAVDAVVRLALDEEGVHRRPGLPGSRPCSRHQCR